MRKNCLTDMEGDLAVLEKLAWKGRKDDFLVGERSLGASTPVKAYYDILVRYFDSDEPSMTCILTLLL